MRTTTMPTPEPHELTALWRDRWPAIPPVAHLLRAAYPDRWVRFHSLPDAKRYPEAADEWQEVLGRYNAVLDDVFAGMDVYVVMPDWSGDVASERQPDRTFWMAIPSEEWDPESLDSTWMTIPEEEWEPGSPGSIPLFIAQRRWESGCIDTLLRDVANDAINGVLITDTEMRRVYHPYDGGADVLLPTTDERDRLCHQRSDWLPHSAPQTGPQSDGSTVWRVKVADMHMEEHLDFHAFFPEELTINAGDSIWFDYGMGGFHTVSFLSGAEPPPLFMSDPEVGTPTAGEPPKLILNPQVIFPSPNDSYDGTGYANSGIDVFRDSTQPYVLTFTKAGTYDNLCIVHASVMKARVVVQEAGATAMHTQAEYDQIVTDKIAAFRDQAQAEKAKYAPATSTENADGTTSWEATAGVGGDTQVRVQAFLPAELAVNVGDTVKWIHRVPGEPHTISFIGAGATPPEDTIVEQFADGMPKFVQNLQTFLPQGGNVWHGTGWLNSGFLGYLPGQPAEFAVTFDTPGDYTYFCVLQGDAQGNGMAAKITVSPR